MSINSRLPLLREDRSSIDWLHAQYRAEINISGRAATATNTLIDAGALDALIQAGDAEWALELRCPKTLLARVVRSSDPEVRCEWQQTEVDGELFLTSGLIAVRDCKLSADGLNRLWGKEPIAVPAGHWLARGLVLRTKSLASSLLEFHKKPDLKDGEMEVTPDITSGDLRFRVWLAPNYFDKVIQDNRDVQIAALIAAFGRIPFVDSDDSEGYAVLSHIKAALSEAGVPSWGPELNADFDPARAATAIEAFQIAVSPEDDE